MSAINDQQKILQQQNANAQAAAQAVQPVQAVQAAQAAQPVQAVQAANTQANTAANIAEAVGNQPTGDQQSNGLPSVAATDAGWGLPTSANVAAAQSYLNNVLSAKPTQNQGLTELYDRIMNREPFSYDLNGDMLYNQYKQQYQQMGQRAMLDTMGNAAALTGGYGNSYAQSAGNQAYQNYLQQLNDRVPELYNAALNRYNSEGDRLNNLYTMGYGQYRDQMSDWTNNRDYAAGRYDQEMSNAYNERDYAYGLAMSIMQMGEWPTQDLLDAAGIRGWDAQQIIDYYAPKSSSGGGGGGRKSGGGTKSTVDNSNTSGVLNTAQLANLIKTGTSANKVNTEIGKSSSAGMISPGHEALLLRMNDKKK